MGTYKDLLQNIHDVVFSEHEYEKTVVKEMRTALQNLFKKLFDDKSYAIYIFDITSVDPREYFLYMNDAIEKVTTFTPQEVMDGGYDFIIDRWKEEEKQMLIDAHEVFFSNILHLNHNEALQQVCVTYNHFRTRNDTWIEIIATGRVIRFHERGKPHLMMGTIQRATSVIYPLPNIEKELHEVTAPFTLQLYSQMDANVSEGMSATQNEVHVLHLQDFLKRMAARDLSLVLHNEFLVRFLHDLLRLHYDFTLMELKICLLIVMGMTSNTIAQNMNLSLRTIENHRNHIRKKMNLSPSQNLTTVLMRIYTRQK